MPSNRPDVVIVGAGVIGLSTGIRLAEQGLRVRLYADRPTGTTSSYAAGAIFDPFLADHARRDTWAAATHRELARLRDAGHPWVRVTGGIEASRTPMSPPPRARLMPGFREYAPADLPPGFVSGWRYRAPLVAMPPYLAWLGQRLARLGGEVRHRRLETLDEGFADADVVVNCSGIGARELVPDGTMQPIRGQLVVIRNPGIDEFFVEHTPDLEAGDSTYLLPQGDLLLLGGNAEKGELEPLPDERVWRAILRRCREAFPRIAAEPVIGHRTGIRPHRATVRLEHRALRDRRHIVHNYGHGGSGVSLSWGCADDVTAIVLGLSR